MEKTIDYIGDKTFRAEIYIIKKGKLYGLFPEKKIFYDKYTSENFPECLEESLKKALYSQEDRLENKKNLCKQLVKRYESIFKEKDTSGIKVKLITDSLNHPGMKGIYELERRKIK